MAAPADELKPRSTVIREAAAIAVWGWTFVKLFVFDLDVFIVRSLAPSYLWLLNFKILFISALLSLVWLLTRQRSLFEFLLYIVAYPAVWS